jgi:hypothetical protein
MLEERDFTDAQAVVIDQAKERTIPRVRDRLEEGANFDLGEVAGQALMRARGAGHGLEGIKTKGRTAPFSETVQCCSSLDVAPLSRGDALTNQQGRRSTP